MQTAGLIFVHVSNKSYLNILIVTRYNNTIICTKIKNISFVILRALFAEMAYSIGVDYRQSCSGNKDFFRAYCQRSSGDSLSRAS